MLVSGPACAPQPHSTGSLSPLRSGQGHIPGSSQQASRAASRAQMACSGFRPCQGTELQRMQLGQLLPASIRPSAAPSCHRWQSPCCLTSVSATRAQGPRAGLRTRLTSATSRDGAPRPWNTWQHVHHARMHAMLLANPPLAVWRVAGHLLPACGFFGRTGGLCCSAKAGACLLHTAACTSFECNICSESIFCISPH